MPLNGHALGVYNNRKSMLKFSNFATFRSWEEEEEKRKKWKWKRRQQNNNNCINLPAGVRAALSYSSPHLSLMGVIIEAETKASFPTLHTSLPICSTLKRQNPSTFRSICAHNELPDGAGRRVAGRGSLSSTWATKSEKNNKSIWIDKCHQNRSGIKFIMPSAGGHPTLIRGWNPLGEIERLTERYQL